MEPCEDRVWDWERSLGQLRGGGRPGVGRGPGAPKVEAEVGAVGRFRRCSGSSLSSTRGPQAAVHQITRGDF